MQMIPPVPAVGIKFSYFVAGVGYVPISSPVVQTGTDGKYSAGSLSATTNYRVDLIRNAALTGATLIAAPTTGQKNSILVMQALQPLRLLGILVMMGLAE